MDPLTHAALGVSTALASCPSSAPRRVAALVGLAAGMLPDIDIFLKSATDPLFSLEYHRHFTHSLLFSPVIACAGLLVTRGVLWPFALSVPWRSLLLPAWLAALSHLFCDLWTSYGTRLYWPFADTRAALDWISVIDPLLTLPLLFLALAAVIKRQPRTARLALAWVAFYLTAAVTQQFRAHTALQAWLEDHATAPADRLCIHPSFGNILVWRGLAEVNGTVQAFSIRCGIGEPRVWPGQTGPVWPNADQAIAALRLDPSSRQARDVRRFFHFSMNWVAPVPGENAVLGDIRYATLPQTLVPLWGIELLSPDSTPPIRWRQFRTVNAETWRQFLNHLFGSSGPSDAR